MCVQNYVAMDFSANVLLAAGASPAMVDANEECDPFTMISSALSVNVGTALSPHWIQVRMCIRVCCVGVSVGVFPVCPYAGNCCGQTQQRNIHDPRAFTRAGNVAVGRRSK